MKKHKMKKAFAARLVIVILCIIAMTAAMVWSVKKINTTRNYVSQLRATADTLYISEIGHLKWSSRLNASIQYKIPFTGSNYEKECVLGEHIYSDAVQNDSSLTQDISIIEPLHKEIHQEANNILALVATDKAGAERLYQQRIQEKIDQLLQQLDTSIVARQALIREAEKSLQGILNLTVAAALLLPLVILAACLNLSLYIRTQIGEPILAIAQTAKKLAKGQLDLDFTTSSQNEIGELGQVLNHSVREISEYIADIDRAMSAFSIGNFDVAPSRPFIGDFKNIERSISRFIMTISKTLGTIIEASAQVSYGAEHISNSAQALACGATEQAGSVDTLSATIGGLSEHVRQTADNFKNVDQIMNMTATHLADGSTKMDEMTQSMGEIIAFSNKIRTIIQTINDITFQTNILALNAAVEAARAGIAGNGFAVVADEVRNLAQKSAHAAEDISTLIESSITVVGNGAALTEETALVFRRIVEMSAEITKKISEASCAAEEQACSIQQLASGVDQIASVIQANSATSEESAAASEELQGQAHLLKQSISVFKTKNMA